MSEGIFDVILKNRDRLESLRVLNLTHNPIHMDKKAANKMEEVKKMGIIVVMWYCYIWIRIISYVY